MNCTVLKSFESSCFCLGPTQIKRAGRINRSPTRKPCRGAWFDWWTDEPPRDIEIAVLAERSADGNTIDGGLGGAAQGCLVRDSSSGAFCLAVANDGGV